MKKVLSLFLIFSLLFCLCSCGSQKNGSIEIGDKDAFLKAMAVGITNRLQNNRDTDSMTREEIADYYETLVNYELKEIESFENCIFEDTFFNELVHEYISACKTQLTANTKYKNADLYDPLWNGAYSVRAGIIVYLYENYDLPISAEDAKEYKEAITSNSDANFSISGESYDVSSGLYFNYDNMVTESTVIINSDEKILLYKNNKIEITTSNIDIDEYQIDFSVKNNSDSSVTCFLSMATLNKHQITAYSALGYDFTRAGLIGKSYSSFDKEELNKAGMKSSDYIDTHLYVVKSDGTTAYVIADVPVKISCKVF